MNDAQVPALDRIRPTSAQRIYDLAREAGVDVSTWGDFEGGAAKAASNPKYCYEWSYLEPGKLVVLNLWYDAMRRRDDKIVQDLNMRAAASSEKGLPYRGAVVKRARDMDHALQIAHQEGMPVRVVVCDGEKGNRNDPDPQTSKVRARLLDPEPWAVTAYDWRSGACTITRGCSPKRFVDQFTIEYHLQVPSERRRVERQVFDRSSEVRKRVRARANGKCEWCGESGFEMAGDRVYIETHHIIPLAQGGEDGELNVVALCANHHREAHHGVRCDIMRRELLSRVRELCA